MNKFVKRYFIDGLGAMANGLFASLLTGTILKTIGGIVASAKLIPLSAFLLQIGEVACNPYVVGACMAAAIAYKLNASFLVLLSLCSVGAISNKLGGAGGPLSVFVIAVIAMEVGNLVSGKTQVDILVTPLVTIITGSILAFFLASYIGKGALFIGRLVMWATTQHPFIMGVVISLVVGAVLTLPISSAALCAALGLTGLAGGAAVAGCCANMIGFAVISFRDNRWGGLVSQGLGTSMLQLPNIIKKPIVWTPVLLSSAITGALSTCLFKLEMNGEAVSSGMGTCGLVGQIGVITGWHTPSAHAITMGASPITPSLFDWAGLFLISFILPAVLSYLFYTILRKAKIIQDGDLKI